MTTIPLLALTKAILYQVAVLIGLIAGLAGCSFLFRNPTDSTPKPTRRSR